jgi:hypothetical protein
MELDEENYYKFHENQPDDPRIMTQEITWSEKVSIVYFSLVQKTNKNELNRMVTPKLQTGM